jgi:hypothetical protein
MAGKRKLWSLCACWSCAFSRCNHIQERMRPFVETGYAAAAAAAAAWRTWSGRRRSVCAHTRVLQPNGSQPPAL